MSATTKQFCPCGHDTEATGRYFNGRCKQCARAYYQRNREARLAYQRDYYQRNRERVIAHVRAWQARQQATTEDDAA